MAKNSFLEWDTTASSNTDIGGIGVLGTNAVSNFDDAFRTLMAQLRAGVDGEVVYATKSGNYTAVANDNNAAHRFTATATLSLTAAATLGANWHYLVTAVGSTVLTIDPNASETIGGVATLIIRGGQSALIICDGTNFQVEIRGTAYASQSGNYTALLGDTGTTQRFTAAATLTLTAAATLGAGWKMDVVGNGGAVTIDPNGSETINGLTTQIVPDGSTATIICDGSNFFFSSRPTGWQFIEKRDFSAASAVDFTNLSPFQRIRLTGYITFSVAADLALRFSTDNGSSFISTSSYGWQILVGASTAAGAARTNPDTFIILSSPSPTIIQFTTVIDNMNSSSISASVINSFTEITSGNFAAGVTGGNAVSGTAKNAIRLLPTTGTMTGNVTIEGMV